MFEEGELGRVEAIRKSALPEERSARFVGIGKVDLKEIIGRAYLAAEGDTTACAGTSAGARTGTTAAGPHGRSGTDLTTQRCGGKAALADHEDEIRLFAAGGHDVAIPIVESSVNVGDGVAVVWLQARIEFLAVFCFDIDVARLVKGGG